MFLGCTSVHVILVNMITQEHVDGGNFTTSGTNVHLHSRIRIGQSHCNLTNHIFFPAVTQK